MTIDQVTFLVEPDGDGFHAWCPELKGVHAPGATADEAVGFAREAARLYIFSQTADDKDPA